MAKVMKTKPTHVFIPDTQVKPGVPTDHISWAGEEIASRKPDVIVQIGDWADMASLSSYDKGKYGFEDRRYEDDVTSAQRAWDLLDAPIRKVRGYRPRKVFTRGNHEARIDRALETEPYLTGMRYVAGLQQRGTVAGAFYLHDEDYKGPQGNAHWRGIIFKHEVDQGQYDVMELSMDYLCRKYEGMELKDFLKKKYKRSSDGLWLPK